MAALNTSKTIEVMLESYIDTHNEQDSMLSLVDFEKPNAADLQNSLNTIWRPIQQNAPTIRGWDLTGQETGVIEENVPLSLEDPVNDIVELRADDVRDERFWRRRAQESAKREAAELNKSIANRIVTEGSLFYRGADVSGFDFVSSTQVILDERQTYGMERKFVLNVRDNRKFASDLAARQTLAGRPEDVAWKKGFVGRDVAEFDVYKGSFIGTLAGGASPDTTVSATVSEKPEGFVQTGNTQGNIDYRNGTIPVVDATGYAAGDKIQFPGVQSLALMDKTPTGQTMTFTVVEQVDPTTLRVFPKPIAQDDPALSILEAASANIDTQIASGMTVSRVNIDALARPNIFFDKSAICVLGGVIPVQKFSELDGFKVVTSTMKNGQEVYMLYRGSIEKMSFTYRIFTWWGVNVINPSACGIAISI